MRRIPVSDIEQRIKHAVAEQLGIRAEEIKNEASFMDDLGADSLDLVELNMKNFISLYISSWAMYRPPFTCKTVPVM